MARKQQKARKILIRYLKEVRPDFSKSKKNQNLKREDSKESKSSEELEDPVKVPEFETSELPDTIQEPEPSHSYLAGSLTDSFVRLKSIHAPGMPVLGPSEMSYDFSCVAPVLGYRNKCEFAIGKNPQNEIRIGFSIRKNEQFYVLHPESCLHVSEGMKAFVKYMVEFVQREVDLMLQDIREESLEARNTDDTLLKQNDLCFWNRQKNQGIWRILSLREFSSGQLMALFQLDPTLLSVNFLDAFRERLVNYCKAFRYVPMDDKANFIVIGSLQLQLTNAKGFAIDEDVPLECLLGPMTLIDTIGNCQFNVSARSFFQVNPQGTKLLYDVIRDVATGFDTSEVSTRSKKVLFDLCCGNGTIGIYLATYFSRVIGIEMVPEAIENARQNSLLNGATSPIWICGKLEDTLQKAIQDHVKMGEELVVILDPPRAGAHPNVIKTLRSIPQVKHLIYVSCMPDLAFQNWIDLSRPSSNRFFGVPFQCDTMIPVDLFPMTEHYELILSFRR